VRLAAVLCALLLAAACERAAKPAAAQPKKAAADAVPITAEDAPEPPGNLLEIGNGGAVVWRSGENSLDGSALLPIDGEPASLWKSAPQDAERVLVYALPAIARITSVGVHGPTHKWDIPIETRIDGSADNVTWRELARLPELGLNDRRVVSIPPATIRYVRFRFINPPNRARYFTAVRSVVARGELVERPNMPSVAGCWTINGQHAQIEQQGNRVFGVVGQNPATLFSGARDAKTIRLMWRRGPQWGHALMTIDPQRTLIGGQRWHEAADPKNTGDSWFGEPVPCANRLTIGERGLARAILSRAGRWTAYSDDSLDLLAELIAADPKSRFRVTARSRERMMQVRTLLQDRVDRTRVDLTVGAPESAAKSETIRVMHDGVELHVLR
jgi:hypothetical protein